ANLAGITAAGGMNDRFHGCLHEGVVDGNLQLQFRQQADLELLAAVDLGIAALPAAAADVADGHQVNVALVESGLDRLELFRPNNRHDVLHSVGSFAKETSGDTKPNQFNPRITRIKNAERERF